MRAGWQLPLAESLAQPDRAPPYVNRANPN